MKLFLRDHLPLTFFYFLQLAVVLLVFWLDGFERLQTALYAWLLSTCIYVGYLFYRYMTNRSFYQQLANPPTTLDDLQIKQQAAPLPKSLEQLQSQLIRHYRQKLHNYKYKLDHHINFINQWVHQMKTPLSVIHLMTQERDDEFVESINDEVDRLKKGLEMVLYSSRLDTFERDFFVESLNLYTVVRTVTSNQKRLFIRNRVYPEVAIDPGIIITSDEKWLSFVLMQITTNAVRYTGKRGGKIIFRATQDGDKTVLEIQDFGVGIAKSDLPRVFDPYFTGENGREFQESTGMGLYLVKQICDKLGHQVEVESAVNVGTTIRIYF